MTVATPARPLPVIIQGGMGVGVSNWRLAQAVAKAGGLGVVSGIALERLVMFRLQEGDPGGNVRRVLARFPVPDLAQRFIATWLRPDGTPKPGLYRPQPMYTHELSDENQAFIAVATYAEIALAKEGHDGMVGINLLEKIQLPNLATVYGAMLAGVDCILMGAGIPREFPGAIESFTRQEPASISLHVEGALPGEDVRLSFDPRRIMGVELPPLPRPRFLAVIASNALAQAMLRSPNGVVDGFVVEGPTAGGHNAPPRGNEGGRSESGEPIYGARDVVDLKRLAALGKPFWLAGGFGHPDRLQEAKAAGAQGIQVGTAFALSIESGLEPAIKQRLLEAVRSGGVTVFTDPLASPTGFPFKVVQLPGTLGDKTIYDERTRVCKLGYLREAYRKPDGAVGWRCGAEPETAYVAKGGLAADAVGRMCLCNGLVASAGFPMARSDGRPEPQLLTAGDDLVHLGKLFEVERTAAEVIAYITGA